MELTYVPIPRDRVLAVDPCAKGFGFVVLEIDPVQIVDWGVRSCSRSSSGACASVLKRMFAKYEPTTLLMEDAFEAVLHRAISIEGFLADIEATLLQSPVGLSLYTRHQVQRAFASTGAVTKEQIAKALVMRFPELRAKEPRHRNIWESEDSRMSIFDALSFALTHFAPDDS